MNDQESRDSERASVGSQLAKEIIHCQSQDVPDHQEYEEYDVEYPFKDTEEDTCDSAN
jgi:hypothetical protein